MSNIHNSTIYENGISLSDSERSLIRDDKTTVSEKLEEILSNRPNRGFNYGELILLLETETGRRWSKDTVSGRLSEMAGAKGADEGMKDKYGRWPLVKLDEKRPNPLMKRSIDIHLYAWNKRYGKPPNKEEIVAKNAGRQQNFHGDLFEGAEA